MANEHILILVRQLEAKLIRQTESVKNTTEQLEELRKVLGKK